MPGLSEKDLYESRRRLKATLWNAKNPDALIRACGRAGWNSGDLDVAFQLFSCGMVWDGNLSSKDGRDHLVSKGYAVRHEGVTAMTGKGTVAFVTSIPVALSAWRRWRRWKKNPLVATPETVKRAMT